MAVVCARCGTQNPDGNQFCQACGTPLAATAPASAVPVGPSAAAPFTSPPAPVMQGAPPPAPGQPPAYQSPYYAPSAMGPQPPVHRAPWMIIIAAMVGLVVIMVGVGAVIAIAHGKSTSQANSFKSLSSPSPAVTPSPGGSPAPSPSPDSSPAASPSPQPTQPTGGASNAAESVPLPSGWTVINKDNNTIQIQNPNGDGMILIASGTSNPPQTAQQNKDTIDTTFKGHYPDTKDCPNSTTSTGPMGGVSGIYWELCFTLTSGGQSVQTGVPLFAGANADGTIYYLVELVTTETNMNNFITEATPILSGIQWNFK